LSFQVNRTVSFSMVCAKAGIGRRAARHQRRQRNGRDMD